MESRKSIFRMTRKEMQNVPFNESGKDIGKFSCLVIIPTYRFHDSGYRIMDFVAVSAGGFPICRLSGCSDVINIDGIGGRGKNWLSKPIESTDFIAAKGWSIDCLPCGYLCLWTGKPLSCSLPLSSFQIFSDPE